MNDWVLVGIGLLLTFGTGIFVASEFALVNLDRRELESRQERGEKGLGPTIKALKITSTHLSSAQLGITITTLLTGYTFEPAISSLLREPLRTLGVSENVIPGIGSLLGVALATLLSMVIGELIPKNFALAVPLATSKVVIPFQAAFTTVFKPVILFCNNTANAIVRSFGIEPKEELSGARSAEELSSLVRHSALAGVLDQDQAALLHRTLRFSDRVAYEVMTPRVLMNSVDTTASAGEIVALASKTGHSRFPVMGRNIDDIIGVVHLKHAFAVPVDQWQTVKTAEMMTPIVRVPETMRVDALLGALRANGFQIGVVVDEYGGTAGIVTLEDLVEELVGELADEHDLTASVVTRAGQTVIFSAALRPDELLDRTGIAVPEDEDYETIGGFIASRLNRLPVAGDEVALDHGIIRVDRMVRSRVDRLRYLPTDPETDPAFVPVHERLVTQITKDLPNG